MFCEQQYICIKNGKEMKKSKKKKQQTVLIFNLLKNQETRRNKNIKKTYI